MAEYYTVLISPERETEGDGMEKGKWTECGKGDEEEWGGKYSMGERRE